LYSSAPDATRRHSAQSALLEMLRTIAVLLAPVLSFTAEEAWQSLPAALRGPHDSVFDIAFPHIDEVDPIGLADWQLLKELRAQVAAAGTADFALDARITVPAGAAARLTAMADNVREALIVSALLDIGTSADGTAVISTEPAHGEKCARCWKYLPLGSDAAHPLLCAPCAQIVTDLRPG
jgi:isoleucyl-tRNA synthetase